LHKLHLKITWEIALKKLIKSRDRIYHSANNHKIPSCHKMMFDCHNVSKGQIKLLKELASVYEELDADYQSIDLIDLEFYERWLNGRY